MNDRPTYKDFSETLFWDVDPQEVDFDRNRRWFVVRVLEYGRIEDWKSLLKLYPLEEIVLAAQTARTLEPKALSFLSFVSGTPKESFRCFIMKRYVISGVEVDVVIQPYQWLEGVLEQNGIRLATCLDVAAMKMLAVMNRGSRKDFVDLSFLLEKYTLAKIIEGASVKYPGISQFAMCKSLVYFEDAEEEPMPRMLTHRSWEEVKRLVSDAVEEFIN